MSARKRTDASVPHWRERLRPLVRRGAVAAGAAAALATLLTLQVLPNRVSLQLGDVVRQDVRAYRYARYLDEEGTERLRALAAARVDPIFSRDVDARLRAEDQLDRFFAAMRAARRDAAARQIELPKARAALPAAVDSSVLRAGIELPAAQLDVAEAVTRSLVRGAMDGELSAQDDSVRQARLRAARDPQLEPLPLRARAFSIAVARATIQPNMVLDSAATEARRRQERAAVLPAFTEVARGDLVIRKGERVRPQHLRAFAALGLQRPGVDPPMAVALGLLSCALVTFAALYLSRFHPEVARDDRRVLLLALLALAPLIVFKLSGLLLGINLTAGQLGYVGVMAVVTAAMLITTLVNAAVAFFIGTLLAVVVGLMTGGEMRFALMSLLAGVTGIYSVINVRSRMTLLAAGAAVAAVTVVIGILTGLLAAGGRPESLGREIAWGVLGGFIATGVYAVAATLLERPFRVLTHVTLLELSDPNSPLLRRLALEAPGTYAHSIAVGTLSEAAADAVGAEALFARVASYYHDIGKVFRPQFFIENQRQENCHDRLNPTLSRLVVLAHVKDGVALAEENRLPPRIIDVIREHHGTSLVRYFYHRATVGGEAATPALEFQFRYEGPKPQTKESGIIMLADSVEAASRSLEKPTPSRVEALVQKIVRDWLADGQLDDCDLTLKDLDRIVGSFTRTLVCALHARVEYPETERDRHESPAAYAIADSERVLTTAGAADSGRIQIAG